MKKLLAILICYVLFNASTCEEDLRVPGENPEPGLVITGDFSTEFVIELYVTTTLPLFDPFDGEFIENASIELFEEAVKVDEFNYDPNTASYYSNIIPAVDKEYTVKVSAPGFETIEATNIIPKPVETFEISVNDIKRREITNDNHRSDLEISFNATVTINDPSDDENYYHINFSLIDSLRETVGGNTITYLAEGLPIVLKDPINNSPAIPGFSGAFVRDQMFNGQSQDFVFNITNEVIKANYLSGDLVLEIRSVSEEYYLYHTSLYRQYQASQVPLSEPVQVFTNIKNGYGLFGGYSFIRKQEAIRD